MKDVGSKRLGWSLEAGRPTIVEGLIWSRLGIESLSRLKILPHNQLEF